ncbi:unnamed protein product, partial [Rotaria sp. Silwood1]
MLASLTELFVIQKPNLNNIPFRNVTKLRFGSSYSRTTDPCDELIEEDKALAIVFSSIISMTVQLKYIFIDRFEWFLYIIRYAFDISLKNALRTIRHAEFRISSCNVGYNESVHIGKYLVPLLSTYMPHLQTLCLWRPDDFPWTS